MSKKYTGFESYLTTGTFTKEFIEDYRYWCKRTYWAWKGLRIEFDTFYETCWEALLSKINEFDPDIATIQTFCISRINNEAWRQYMRNKSKKPETDCDSEVMQNTLQMSTTSEDIIYSIDDFIRYCNKMSVQVNKKKFLEDYYEEKETAPVLAYAWWKAENNEVGGRDDIQKRKRCINA